MRRTDTKEFRFCLVGAGLMGLCIIERLYAWVKAGKFSQARLTVVVFEKRGRYGGGVHDRNQPATNHLNRVAAQVSFGADESHAAEIAYILPKSERLTLVEWCRARYHETGDERYFVSEQAWIDRYLLGEAAEDMFDRYVRSLRNEGVVVEIRSDEVVDISPTQAALNVYARRETHGLNLVECDFVALATGHLPPRIRSDSPNETYFAHSMKESDTSYLHDPYPIEKLDGEAIAPNSPVALRGMGLVTLDILLRLSIGRGGYFVKESDRPNSLVYVRSGFEPSRVIAFGRSGMFNLARPWNEKGVDPNLLHRPIFFNNENIDRLRAAVGVPMVLANVGAVHQLDFALHVLPLMVLEMSLVYYKTLFGGSFYQTLITSAAPLVEQFVNGKLDGKDGLAFLTETIDVAASMRALEIRDVLFPRGATEPRLTSSLRESLIAFLTFRLGKKGGKDFELVDDVAAVDLARARRNLPSPWEHSVYPDHHLFSWIDISSPFRAFKNLDVEERRVQSLRFFERDLCHAYQGNISNPLKAAIDGIWRDLRSTLRYAVEFGGLLASSQAIFTTKYTHLNKRLASGTSLHVMEQIGALIRAGFVDLSLSMDPQIENIVGGGFVISNKGRDPQHVRVFVNSRLPPFHLEDMDSELYGNLSKRGLVRLWENPSSEGEGYFPGGVDIYKKTHMAIGADGTPSEVIAVLGPHTEGAYYFPMGAVRPYCEDPIPMYAEKIVAQFNRVVTARIVATVEPAQ